MRYLGIFELGFEKTIAIFEMSNLTFHNLQNFAKKTIMPKSATKNTFFPYFWASILKKYCHI